MTENAFQDYYPEYFAHCYGCGSMNGLGHQIKSVWDGEESVCHFQPKSYYTAIPGYVYGGLLASLVDCHGTGTAAAAGYRSENRPMDTEPPLRYLTASLHVDYLKPTPMGHVLEIRAKVKAVKGRKVVIEEWIVVNGVITVRGEVVAVQVPEQLVKELLLKDKGIRDKGWIKRAGAPGKVRKNRKTVCRWHFSCSGAVSGWGPS